MTTSIHPAPAAMNPAVVSRHHAGHPPIRLYPQRALRVYLAGPDVFDRDSGHSFTRLSRLAHAQGLAPIVPMEGWGNVNPGPGTSVAPSNGSASKDPSEAQRIFAANIARLDSADGVLANLRDFRGNEPDSWTVFEVGYAFARGIPVVAYGVPQTCYASRVGLRQACERDELGALRETATGCQVEDFGQRLNLMLACAVGIEVDAASAMARLAECLRQ